MPRTPTSAVSSSTISVRALDVRVALPLSSRQMTFAHWTFFWYYAHERGGSVA